MVILDTSAIISILRRESCYQPIERCIVEAGQTEIGAPTLVETNMVAVARLGIRGKTSVARFLQERNIEIIPFTADHFARASEAFERFGKGRHPAGLNLGDCYSYATAALAGRPLLCVGDDFPQTDLTLVPLGET